MHVTHRDRFIAVILPRTRLDIGHRSTEPRYLTDGKGLLV